MSSLEERVAALEEQVAMEAGLRASVDDDVATLGQRVRAMNHLVQALSITQAEHTEEFAKVRTTLGEHGGKLDTIVTLLQTLIERGD
jgi:hypothetical protein